MKKFPITRNIQGNLLLQNVSVVNTEFTNLHILFHLFMVYFMMMLVVRAIVLNDRMISD
jgi:hypothetical protein